MSDKDNKSYMRDGRLIVPWRLSDGRILHMLTPEELSRVPDGTELVSINGRTYVKGRDKICDDTRRGITAFGLLSLNDAG